MADNFLQKSFLFEVVDSKTEIIDASFTLVIPPNAYSIKEPHRVNITKTFGNAFIDDYGPDNIQLVIKGISGTAHAFPTFRSRGNSKSGGTFASVQRDNVVPPTEAYTGKSAFYTFRDEIMRYKDNFKSSFDQKELRVYDLADEQAYKCVLLEFSLDRTAERPFHYPYQISLMVYAKLGSKEAYSPKKITISKNPNDVLTALQDAADSLEERFKVFENIQNIINQIAKTQNQIKLMRAQFNTFLTEGRRIVESPLLITKQLIDTLGVLGGFMYDAYTQGKLAYDTWVNAGETIQNQIREILGMYGFAIGEGSQQSTEESFEQKNGMDYSDPSNPVPATSFSTFAFDGINNYTVLGGDTLQSIAQSQLGDATLWPFVASVNDDIGSNADLVVGNEIYVPASTNPGFINKDSFIITEDNARDPYGVDVQLVDGALNVQESGDVALIGNTENVLQAVDIRLNTQVNSMIAQTAFGLMTQPGLAGTAEAVSYVRMGIKDAIIKDPRIASVDNVQVSITGDTIQVSADIILIGREPSLPISVILH